jgi:hypothetical protein
MFDSRATSSANHNPKLENRSAVVLVDATASQNSGSRK